MNVDFSKITDKNQTVAIAVSGGSDSMALLHYMRSNADLFGIKVIALNVEHGIRGESSKKDTEFVKSYCKDNGIELLTYSCDALKKSKEDKISVELSARLLRYDCFFDAIKSGKCDFVATAHHQRDNVESVLINLFRGTGLKGVSGIPSKTEDKIIRPFLYVPKEEIDEYIKENKIPFVTDETNLKDDYTRNFIRLNVIPKIKEVFPEAETCISRFTKIAKCEDEFLDGCAVNSLTLSGGTAKIALPLHVAVLNRAIIIALKSLGLKKDWEKIHVDEIVALSEKENGTTINLPKNLLAVKEYDSIVIYTAPKSTSLNLPFSLGEIKVQDKTLKTEIVSAPENLKSGLFADYGKIPKTAVIRYKEDGDVFTKFNGGTKSLSDYFTDVKIPLRLRKEIPLLCNKNKVLAIFGVAISDDIKVDEKTTKIIKFTYEDQNEKT